VAEPPEPLGSAEQIRDEGVAVNETRLFVCEPLVLGDRGDQDAGTMSGGQQQMLAIGRALVGDPDLLLVDEPSEGVQPSIVQSITEDLGRINEDLGTTILFVEQNLSVVQNLAERCYAMDKGQIVDELDGSELDDREHLADHLAV